MEDLKGIRLRRKKLNMTQTEFARISGVSQSLVAKVESGIIDPSYSNAQKIFSTLGRLESSQELSAKDIMHRKIISLSPVSDLREAVDKMKRHEISQLPVIDGSRVVGFVSEATILEKMLQGKTGGMKVSDFMEECPPIIPEDTSRRAIVDLLKHFPLVLVSKQGMLSGIITRSDLLRSIYE